MAAGLVLAAALPASAQIVTFYRDVLPILQNRCQGCHRPGEIGPMPLGTYEEARPYARAIKQATSTRKMPPWNVEAPAGRFHNDPSLSSRELETFSAWGLPVNANWRRHEDVSAVQAFCSQWEERRDSLDYEIDGVVVKVDDFALQDALGAVSHDLDLRVPATSGRCLLRAAAISADGSRTVSRRKVTVGPAPAP